MSDEQQGGMEPEAGTTSGRLTEDEPADDTEGHSVRGRPEEQGEQAGSETGTEAEGLARPGRYGDDADTEGHAVRGRPAKDDEELGSETGTEASDDEDAEGHRASMYSDRDLKRDITPVSW